MKKITLYHALWCPHCKNAKAWLGELLSENENYKKLNIELVDIDAEPEKIGSRKFYYVPTFYLDDDKAFEGVASKDIVKKVLDMAME